VRSVQNVVELYEAAVTALFFICNIAPIGHKEDAAC
jgi:hypothetical protein